VCDALASVRARNIFLPFRTKNLRRWGKPAALIEQVDRRGGDIMRVLHIRVRRDFGLVYQENSRRQPVRDRDPHLPRRQ
jgi:hypothetical protein